MNATTFKAIAASLIERPKRAINLDDTKDRPHIVVFEKVGECRMCEFEGPGAMERAHDAAVESALSGGYVATVGLRVRTCGSLGLMKELGRA